MAEELAQAEKGVRGGAGPGLGAGSGVQRGECRVGGAYVGFDAGGGPGRAVDGDGRGGVPGDR